MSARKKSTRAKTGPRPGTIARTALWIDSELVMAAKKVAFNEQSKIVKVVEAILRKPLLKKAAKY